MKGIAAIYNGWIRWPEGWNYEFWEHVAQAFVQHDEEDESLDEFDDEDDLYYDDVFKEEEDIEEPYDDVEEEDGYSRYVHDASEELMEDDELNFDDDE